jgi:hypothetical protein
MAAQAVTLDQTEKAQIAKAAAEQQAAIERAKERERIAKEAREAVAREAARQQEADRTAAAARQSAVAAEQAAAAVAEAEAKLERDRSWLIRAAELVGRKPGSISLVYLKTGYGVRVLINPNCDQYNRDHLSDYNADKNEIKTKRDLVPKKKDLIAFSVEFRAAYRSAGKAVLLGNEYEFPEVTPV